MYVTALYTVKSYKEYSGMLEYTLYGYVQDGETVLLSTPLAESGFYREKDLIVQKWRKRIFRFAKKRNLRFYFPEQKTDTVEPRYTQGQHWTRTSGPQWKKKTRYTRSESGKWYFRAECLPDTALHHRNCGLPIPIQTSAKWDEFTIA